MLSKFADHLERCINASGLTENQLAKVSGFARSYIALMKNGQRISPDSGKMRRLLDALQLPPYEYECIWAEYRRARAGEDVYARDFAVKELIESFGLLSVLPVTVLGSRSVPDVNAVNGRMNLEYLLLAVLEREAAQEEGFVHIVMQPDLPVLRNLLPNICRNRKRLSVEQLICLENDAGKNSEEIQWYNIQILRALLPLIAGGGENYRSYYYYDKIAAHFSTASLFPYMIVTSEYAVCINAAADKGIVLEEKESLQLCEALFQEHKNGCRPLIKYLEEEVCTYDRKEAESVEAVCIAAVQPYFGVLKLDDILRKYVIHRGERTRMILRRRMNPKDRSAEGEMRKLVCYCTKKGLQKFVEKGIMEELPQELFSPLETADRIEILRRFLEMMQRGTLKLYLLEEEELKFPKELYLFSMNFMETRFWYCTGEEKRGFVLREGTLTRVLYEYFRDLMKNPQMCSGINGEEYLRELLEKLKTL